MVVIATTGFAVYRSQLRALPILPDAGSGNVTVCPAGIDDLSRTTDTAISSQPVDCGGEVCIDDPVPRDVPPAIKDGQKAAEATSPILDVKVDELKAQIDRLLILHRVEIELALKNFYDRTFDTNVDAEEALSATLAISQDLYTLLKNNSDLIMKVVNSDVGKAAQQAYFKRIFKKEEKHFGSIWSGTLDHKKTTDLTYDTTWNLLGTGGLSPTLSVNGLYELNVATIAVVASYSCKPLIGKAKDDILSNGNWQAGIRLTAPTHILGRGVQQINLELSASNKKPITFEASLKYKF